MYHEDDDIDKKKEDGEEKEQEVEAALKESLGFLVDLTDFPGLLLRPVSFRCLPAPPSLLLPRLVSARGEGTCDWVLGSRRGGPEREGGRG